MLPKNGHGCPYLQLAPMEGVGDRCFRKAIASIGGFDEAVRDFIRVPREPHIPSLAKLYEADELGSIPLAAQLMGSEPEHMAEMAREMERKGAPRIDVNCGCPSNTVTGRGAGSSLLKEPHFLHEVARAVVQAVSIPVTLKMRSGFEDISLFEENLKAAEESGVRYITLHPRTKVDGYGPPARWDLIARAKSILKIPLVGNGDILTVEDALRMLETTGCDGLMIGRGSVINPFIFHQIKAHFAKTTYTPKWDDLLNYLNIYQAELFAPLKTKLGKMKQLMGFLFKATPQLMEMRNSVLTAQHADFESFIDFVLPLLKQGSHLR
jgi:tRNA-dihydrouridine synthase C